jgi:undecaprenyl-diphosphatase
MPLWQAIILGAVQGLTEFLPISSTAHLILVPWLFGWQPHGLTFDVAIHIGTLVAVLLYFSRTWVDITLAGLGLSQQAAGQPSPTLEVNHNRRLFWLLVIGTIPAGVAGLLFQEQIETTLRQPVVIGIAMILVAGVMVWGERVGTYNKELQGAGLADSLWIGFSQAVALVPGVSRSGITMAAALFRGFSRPGAARYSFLLATPTIAGAVLKSCLDLYHQGVTSDMVWPLLVGVGASGVVGYAAIWFLLRFLQFGTFKIFIYYRLILGIIVLALAFFVRLEAVN